MGAGHRQMRFLDNFSGASQRVGPVEYRGMRNVNQPPRSPLWTCPYRSDGDPDAGDLLSNLWCREGGSYLRLCRAGGVWASGDFVFGLAGLIAGLRWLFSGGPKRGN